MPVTVACLRFALRVNREFSEGEASTGREFIRIGTRRLGKSMDFIQDQTNGLERQFQRESEAWNLFYKLLEELELALEVNEADARQIADKAQQIVRSCRLS
jgi:hypothetical protein